MTNTTIAITASVAATSISSTMCLPLPLSLLIINTIILLIIQTIKVGTGVLQPLLAQRSNIFTNGHLFCLHCAQRRRSTVGGSNSKEVQQCTNNAGFKISKCLYTFYEEGNALNTYFRPLVWQTECKHDFSLFRWKLHRVPSTNVPPLQDTFRSVCSLT